MHIAIKQTGTSFSAQISQKTYNLESYSELESYLYGICDNVLNDANEHNPFTLFHYKVSESISQIMDVQKLRNRYVYRTFLDMVGWHFRDTACGWPRAVSNEPAHFWFWRKGDDDLQIAISQEGAGFCVHVSDKYGGRITEKTRFLDSYGDLIPYLYKTFHNVLNDTDDLHPFMSFRYKTNTKTSEAINIQRLRKPSVYAEIVNRLEWHFKLIANGF